MLDFSRRGRSRLTQLRAALDALPPWALVEALLAPLLFLGLWVFGVTFFSETPTARALLCLSCAALLAPIALRARTWRHGAVLLASAGAIYAAEAMIAASAGRPTTLGHLVWLGLLPIPLGVAQWFVSPGRGWRQFWALVATCLVAGSLFSIIAQWTQFAVDRVSIPMVNGARLETDLYCILFWPSLAACSWLAIPMANTTLVSRRSVLLPIVLASIGAAFLFHFSLVYALARGSLDRGRPFDRRWAAYLLRQRGRGADFDALWASLERVDWSEAVDGGAADFRAYWIKVLVDHDRRTTAERLSAALRDRPSKVLASQSAEVLAQEKRFEAVPILVRYALLGDSRCIEALEALQIPVAALPIMSQSVDPYQSLASEWKYPISSRQRQRLVRLLGRDVGPDLGDWMAYYDRVGDEIPMPLPDPDAAEVRRVADALGRYWDASNRLDIARRDLVLRRLKESGYAGYADQLSAGTDPESLDGRARAIIRAYRIKVEKDIAVAPPNWDVKTTTELQAEISRFAERAKAAVDDTGAVRASRSN